jgi:hypothetical protein
MTYLHLSHFTAALVCAVCASTVFGITQRNDRDQMLHYAGYCFMWFILGLFAAGWIMWLLHH